MKKTHFFNIQKPQGIYNSTMLLMQHSIINQLYHKSRIKILAVILNEHLNWQAHIDHVANKVSEIVDIIGRLICCLPAIALKSLSCPILCKLQYSMGKVLTSRIWSPFFLQESTLVYIVLMKPTGLLLNILFNYILSI